ncbi:uncharacterized protein [Mytilus edulis]|uniref:uncharacterized protein n=1 Tax=Mytilus edulis TaxID=6550 RepID=UPI0039F0645F
MTWIEANHYCKNKNSTMLQHKIDNVTSDYWRGEYIRLSDWIHTIGCYNWSYLSYHTDPSNTSMILPWPSLGLCQELCKPLSTFAFSVKKNECVCLSKIPLDGGISSQFCNGRCESHQPGVLQHSLPNECGSLFDSSIFNVYTSSPRDTNVSAQDVYDTSELCLAIWCFDEWDVCSLVACGCDFTLHGLFKTKGNMYTSHCKTSWEATVEIGRNRESYLYGNITSTNQAKQIRKRYDVIDWKEMKWLGAARQFFLTVDRGQDVNPSEIVQCNLCSKDSTCDYTIGCDDRKSIAFAVCKENKDNFQVKENSLSTYQTSNSFYQTTKLYTPASISIEKPNSTKKMTTREVHNKTMSRKQIHQTQPKGSAIDNALLLEVILPSLFECAIIIIVLTVWCVSRRKKENKETGSSVKDSSPCSSSHL